ncbi:MAG: 3-hydroxyacyl-CoA dehydrogenase [Betaproteobacteria bacterium]
MVMSEGANNSAMAVAVVGGGQMGTGIAHAFAMAGYQVTLIDTQEAQLTRANAAVEEILAQGVKLGKLTTEKQSEVAGRIQTSTDLTATLSSGSFDWVVETVIESMPVKAAIVREADRLLPPGAIIASNTSALSVTEIAAHTSRPDRFIGLHFFNPVHKMKLLEIVRGLATSDDTLSRARELGAALGKTVVVVNDSPGMTTSRMSAMLGNEAMYMLQEGVATAEDIDAALRGGLNHPMGPLELGDLTGWDTRLKVLQHLHQTLGEKFRPCPLIIKMVAAGHAGRKSGRGVYEYRDGSKVAGSGLGAR